MFVGKAGASLKGRLLALPKNILAEKACQGESL